MKQKSTPVLVLLTATIIVGYLFVSKDGTRTPRTNEPQGKIDISAVCSGALAYMTFPDGASADTFVAECKEGKHPEVIEDFKKRVNMGNGAVL